MTVVNIVLEHLHFHMPKWGNVKHCPVATICPLASPHQFTHLYHVYLNDRGADSKQC